MKKSNSLKRQVATALTGALALSVTACSSINSVTPSTSNRYDGTPRHHTYSPDETRNFGSNVVAQKARHHRNDVIDEILAKTQYEFERLAQEYPGAKLSVEEHKVTGVNGDEHVIKFNYETATAYFDIGQYDVRLARQLNDKEAPAVLEFIADQVILILKTLDLTHGQGYSLYGKFGGMADGYPVGKSGVSYRNEYGEISLPAANTKLNGKPHSFRIKPYQGMNNAELAAARAYSMYVYVKESAASVPLKASFNIATTTKKGVEYRNATVELRIKKAT